MKRIALLVTVVLVMAAMMAASAMPAFADANLNAHNCEGSAISGFVPRAVQKGRQADYASNQAQSGTRGDSVESDTALRANCGNNNR